MNIGLGIGLIALVLVGGYVLLRRFESMIRKTTDELRTYSHSDRDWLYYEKALRELRRRGEDIRAETVAVVALLVAESSNKRIAGWLVQSHFADLAAGIKEYRPQESRDMCRQKLDSFLMSHGFEESDRGTRGPYTHDASG